MDPDPYYELIDYFVAAYRIARNFTALRPF